MSALVKAESVTLLSAIEGTFNVQPTAGWRQHQPNASGIADFIPKIKKARRSPLSKLRQNEKGDIVDLDAAPKITHDLNKEIVDYFCPGIFLSAEKICGAGASATAGKFYPSAVTSSQYTCPTMTNALVASTLIYGRGFALAANNGLLVVAASSTTIAIKTSGTAAETPPTNATVEIVGFQGASGDITCTATTILSTSLDFTTLQLVVGQWLWIGGGTAASPGALGFVTAGCRGLIRITAIAAHVITFDRATQAFSTDAGTSQTIQIFFGTFLRDVATDNADYLEQSYQMELSLPGAAAAAATDYVYLSGAMVDTFEINAPAQNLIIATLSMMGCNVTDASTTRATGASSALTPVASAAFNTVTEQPRLRIADATAGGNYDASISVDIETWKLTIKNGLTAQKQQGTFGPKRVISGKCDAELDVTSYLVQDDMVHAIRDNRTLHAEMCLRNADCGVLFDLPAGTMEDGAMSFPANGPVTIAGKFMAFRDPVMNYTVALSKFPFLPAT